jgi:hypothetical protein
MTAISVIYEVHRVIITVMDANGQTVEKLAVQIVDRAIKKIGSLITTALASLMPAIGGFALGVLGGMIFGFIGKKLGEIIFSVHSRVAPGDGPPISDYFSFIYGSNNCFGEPLNQYKLEHLLTVPGLNIRLQFNRLLFDTRPTTTRINSSEWYTQNPNKYLIRMSLTVQQVLILSY